MIAVLAAGDLTDQQTVHFSYALGKAYEHREDWQRCVCVLCLREIW